MSDRLKREPTDEEINLAEKQLESKKARLLTVSFFIISAIIVILFMISNYNESDPIETQTEFRRVLQFELPDKTNREMIRQL